MIYLDSHATTPLAPKALEAMMPYLTDQFGNAASKHGYGWGPQKAVEEARRKVADLIGAYAQEIIFTGGATESNNIALLGAARAYKTQDSHIITTKIEHKSVLNTFKALEEEGFKTDYLNVDSNGKISIEELKSKIRPQTILVSVQAANNEIGTLQNLREIAQLTHVKNILFHTDLCQATSTIKYDMKDLQVDLASLSGHKMYGPKGVGALYVRHQSPRIKLKPLIFGSGQERGLRSGTLNVPAIVGFGKAADLATQNRSNDFEYLKNLRDQLQSKLISKNPKIKVNADIEDRLPHNMSLTLPEGTNIQDYLKATEFLAISTGAACSTAQIDPSHVLIAIGLTPAEANRTIRLGLHHGLTIQDIDKAAEILLTPLT